jgi:hypothetical protein
VRRNLIAIWEDKKTHWLFKNYLNNIITCLTIVMKMALNIGKKAEVLRKGTMSEMAPLSLSRRMIWLILSLLEFEQG